jgi:hypothetical protein
MSLHSSVSELSSIYSSRSNLQLFVGCSLMSYLCYLCLFAYRVVYFALFFLVLCSQCCKFLWICPLLFVPSFFADVYLCKHRAHRRNQNIGVTSICSFNVSTFFPLFGYIIDNYTFVKTHVPRLLTSTNNIE